MAFSFSAIPLRKIVTDDAVIDVLLIALLTAFAFGLNFHPFFFGDELIAYELAGANDSFFSIFQQLNANKPRLVFNAIEALLAKFDAGRAIHVMLVATCMTWINVLIFTIARFRFGASRTLAWLLVFGVLTSRYGIMLYFDYLSGLIETLSTALFLSTALMASLAYRGEFNSRWAIAALITAIIIGLVHERYMVGLLGIGCVIVAAEYLGTPARRRMGVACWAAALGLVPLVCYWLAIKAAGSLSITTVGGDQQVSLGADTLWTTLTYSYNVLLGGNYGPAWLWGQYNYLHPVGTLLGLLTALVTVLILVTAFVRKGFAEHGLWFALGLGTVIVAFIAVASLAGTVRQDARFMFPVGILVLIAWFFVFRLWWRHVAIGLVLATNLIYLALGSHNSMMYVYSSRGANSLASSLLAMKGPGKNGIVIGNPDNLFTVGGGYAWTGTARKGATFSAVNLDSSVHIDPYVEGDSVDENLYDFGLVFTGLGPSGAAVYRWVSMDIVKGMVGSLDLGNFPVKRSLGSSDTWNDWKWRSPPELVDGALKLAAGVEGRLSVPAQDLDEHWLVMRARAQDQLQAPMRLQVNWHTKEDRLLSVTSRIVTPGEAWSSYSTMLYAPPGADFGYVYATLHGEPAGVVEVQAIELK